MQHTLPATTPAPLRATLLVLLAGILAGVAVALGSGPATAADGTIAYVERTDAGLRVTVDVPAGAEVDLAGVTAAVEGTPYPASAERVADSADRVQRTTVLAIDTSDSMEGTRFTAAQAAAESFLQVVPDDVRVGIVTFAGTVTTPLEPTTDRDEARTVLAGLTLSRGTQLYDGVVDAVALATADEGQGSVLVLSDGADTGSTPIEDVVTAVEDAAVPVDVVALEQSRQARQGLEQLTGPLGDVVAADSEALAAAFAAEAEGLARQVSVRIEAPADVVADQVSIAVTLPSDAGPVTARSTLPASEEAVADPGAVFDTIPAVQPSTVAVDAPDWIKPVGIAVFALGLLVAAVMLVPARPAALTVEERVSTYTSTFGAPPTAEKAPAEPALKPASDAAAAVLRRNRGLEERIGRRLETAGSDLKAAEFLLLQVGVLVVSGLLGLLIGRGNIVVGLIFLGLGFAAPYVYLRMSASRRKKKFESLLPETLQLMSGSMPAGLSLLQSVDTVVREGGEPVASEFRRVLIETRLGVSLEDALENLAQRFESKDFAWVVMAIKIQRQVGGNLAELLNTVAETMREREYIRRQVSALSAEGKLSAAVLGGLPPVFLLYLTLTSRDYVAPLFTDVRGIIMLVGGALWLGVGIFWMSKLVKVEV